MLPLPGGTVNFTQDAAAFFVQSWMSSALSQMLHVWQNWSSTSPQDKQEYISYLDVALLSEGKLIDEPANGYTNPMATFSETMLLFRLRFSQQGGGARYEPLTSGLRR